MSTRYHSFAWEPLTMTTREVAEAVFRRPESWFLNNCPPDFPKPVEGLYAVEAVRAWVRITWKVAAPASGKAAAEATIMDRLKHGKAESPLPGKKAA